MTSVGVRELSHHTSRYLAEVKAGRIVTVTERGRAIATIVPTGAEPPEQPPRPRIGGYRSGRALSPEEIDGELARGLGDSDRR